MVLSAVVLSKNSGGSELGVLVVLGVVVVGIDVLEVGTGAEVVVASSVVETYKKNVIIIIFSFPCFVKDAVSGCVKPIYNVVAVMVFAEDNCNGCMRMIIIFFS